MEGAVRLSEGESPLEGRLEVYHAGVWGTVCGRNWGPNNADVVCQQLGFFRAVKSTVSMGNDELPVWLSEVECSGSEKTFQQCYQPTQYGVHTCSHELDIHITCSGLLNHCNLQSC